MAKKVRVGVMGLGWPGREHLKAYVQIPDVEVVALADADETLLKTQADQYDVSERYVDYRAMVEKAELDAVSVCLPNFLHHEASMVALRAGLHTLCEKPPALTAAQAREMADTAAAGKVKLMYAFCVRFGTAAQFLKSAVENGDMGDIYYGHAIYLRQRGIPMGKGGWFVDKKRAGGGALIDIGVHVLDCAWWLMGCPKPVSVSGNVYSKFKATVPANIHFDVDDAAFALIKFENGATIVLETSWALNLPNGHDVLIAGTKGGGRISPLTIFTETQGAPCEMVPQPPEKNGMLGECAHFVDCIVNGKEPLASAEQGAQLMSILDAIYESSETDREVRIA